MMIEETHIFRAIPRPKNVLSEYSLVVVDGNGKPHRMLTIFYDELLHELSDGAARTYLNNLLPYFTYLATDTWRQHRNDTWESPPEAVRESVRDYLLRKLQCKVRQSGTHEFVFLTAQSPSSVRIFLSALKKFYQIARLSNRYPHTHPLADPVTLVMQEMEQDKRRDGSSRPKMPQESGVEPPKQPSHLSENYFRLVGEDWVPQPIDDPELHTRLLAGFEKAKLGLRDQIVIRMAYESGGRIREILQLKVGDWRKYGCNQTVAACNKGSRGRRVKFLRFSAETAKMLRQYLNTERCHLDPAHRRLEHLSDADPLFLSMRHCPYDYGAFKPHWYALCKVVRIDLNIHGLRHWYVSQAMREICETAKSAGEVERGKENLVRYMAWRSPDTLKAYEHHFQAQQHIQLQDQLHQRLYQKDRAYLQAAVSDTSSQTMLPTQPSGPSTEQPSWERLLALGGLYE